MSATFSCPHGQNNAELLLDEETREVSLNGGEVTLTRLEFDLLATLYRSPRRVFTTANLLQEIWHTDWISDKRAIEVYIHRLRKKLGESAHDQHLIRTVRGVGYRYVPATSSSTLPSRAIYDEIGTLQFVSPNCDEILGWPVRDIIGTRFIPSERGFLQSPRFITYINWLAEILGITTFAMKTKVRDRNGTIRLVTLNATFVCSGRKVVGLVVDYLWAD